MSILKMQVPRWAKPLLLPARYKGAYGGRGSGKSHFFAELVVRQHVLDHNCRTICLREIQKSLNQSVKRLIEDKIKALGVDALFEIQESIIKNKLGSGVIMFAGMQNHTSDSIKSLEGVDRAWFEEAQSMSQRSLDLLRPTIRKEGSELWFSWNPEHATDPIDAFLRGDKQPPSSIVVRVNYSDNPWFPEVLKDEMEYDRSRDTDKFLHIWEGEYSHGGEARVFKNWLVEDFETPKSANLYFGADWGFANDPTVLIRCWIEGKKLYIDYEAYRVGCEIMDTPALFLTVPEAEKWVIVADSSRPETISHMQRNGFHKIMPAVKGANSIADGIEFLKSYDITVHPRCKHTIDELKSYSYATDSLTGRVLPKFEDKNNHLIDALRYAVEGVRRVQVNKIDTTPIYAGHGGWS